jgi:hypothetical protein
MNKKDVIDILDAGIAAFEEEMAEDRKALTSATTDHFVISAAHYFGMLNKPVPTWAEHKILHIMGNDINTWDTCPLCEPKDRS